MEIKIKFLENGVGNIPSQNNFGDAGYDLYSTEDAIIPVGERKTLKTGISLAIPYGYVGLIWPRSGLSAKRGVDVLAGVIDSTYRGEIMVCLLNTDKYTDVEIKKGDRIAQILFQKVEQCYFKIDTLDETTRGDAGFGSSG
jgi:dUTP pyrophosphatase